MQILIQCIGLSYPIFCQHVQIGEALAPVWSWAQDWETVRDVDDSYSRFFNYVNGRINLIELNNQNITDDGDWNIFIERTGPDYHFQRLITNRDGEVNEDNMIELELKTPFPFDDYFSVGSTIDAFGWLVEDRGHSAENFDSPAHHILGTYGKTELHPIINFRQVYLNSIKYFTGQDMSGRFITADFPIPPFDPDIIYPNYNITFPLENISNVRLSSTDDSPSYIIVRF